MAGVGIIATSGMKASMTNMEEISNNIANVNTIGFKKANVNFADIHGRNTSANMSSGLGVKISSIQQNFSGGRIETTERGLDISLGNDGFFIQRDSGSGYTSYTRAGRFNVNTEGFIEGLSGRVQGYPATNGKVISTGNLIDLKIPDAPIPAIPSKIARIALNINSAATAPSLTFDRGNPDTYNYRTDTTLYDSLGNPNSLTVFYIKQANNEWSTQVSMNDSAIGEGTVNFHEDGTLNTTTGLGALNWTPTNGAAAQQVALDLSGSTQFSADNQVRSNAQDGNSAGLPVGFNIDGNGKLNVYYSNGLTREEGQIAVAQFKSPQNLARSENMSWITTSESGDPIVNSIASEGAFSPGTVELSNVDLTEELVKLLGAQHDFQANAQVEQTYNQILQTIENL